MLYSFRAQSEIDPHKKGRRMIMLLAIAAIFVFFALFGKLLLLFYLPWWALATLLVIGVAGSIFGKPTKKP
jgi:hypothetical protein